VVSTDGNIAVFVNGVKKKGTTVASEIEQLTDEVIHRKGDSATRNVLDFGVRHGWGHQWLGPKAVVKPTLTELSADLRSKAEAAPTARGQGRMADTLLREAIEQWAMAIACQHFAMSYAVVDPSVAESHPYDILCKTADGGQELHVEVKGTQNDWGTIELTAGEVEHARLWFPRTALAVVWGIDVSRGDDGSISASGGQLRVFTPWQPEPCDLQATRCRYVLPSLAWQGTMTTLSS
jgi:hypothetical protein